MPRKARIVIVEDDENDRFFIQRAFAKAGIDIAFAFANDGDEAIEFLRRRARPALDGGISPPTVLLLDIKMPRLDGFQVLQWVIEHPANRPTRVTILSSSSNPKDIARARALGADSYLVKPIDAAEYVKIVQDLARQAICPSNHSPS